MMKVIFKENIIWQQCTEKFLKERKLEAKIEVWKVRF